MDRFDLATGVLGTAITVGFALASLLAAGASQLTWRGARYRRAARTRAQVRRLAPSRLEPGPVELAGLVEADDAGAPAIAVSIEQRGGREDVNDKYAYPFWRWTEVRRTVSVKPFTLVLHGSAARVRVEADEPAQLCACARLATMTKVGSAGERTWVAQVQHGEAVAILGRLTATLAPAGESDGYRGAPTLRSFVLRSDEGGRLRVVTAGAGAEQDRVIVGRRRIQGILSGIAALTCLAVLSWYAYELHHSVTAVGEVAAFVPCRTKTPRSDYRCFEAVVLPSPGAADSAAQRCTRLGISTSPDPSDQLAIHDRVVLTSVPGDDSRCSLGPKLDATSAELAFLLMGVLGLLFMCLLELAGPREKPWYDCEPLESKEPG